MELIHSQLFCLVLPTTGGGGQEGARDGVPEVPEVPPGGAGRDHGQGVRGGARREVQDGVPEAVSHGEPLHAGVRHAVLRREEGKVQAGVCAGAQGDLLAGGQVP